MISNCCLLPGKCIDLYHKLFLVVFCLCVCFLIKSTSFKFSVCFVLFSWDFIFLWYFFTPVEAQDIDLLASHLASHLRSLAVTQTLDAAAELVSK